MKNVCTNCLIYKNIFKKSPTSGGGHILPQISPCDRQAEQTGAFTYHTFFNQSSFTLKIWPLQFENRSTAYNYSRGCAEWGQVEVEGNETH